MPRSGDIIITRKFLDRNLVRGDRVTLTADTHYYSINNIEDTPYLLDCGGTELGEGFEGELFSFSSYTALDFISMHYPICM